MAAQFKTHPGVLDPTIPQLEQCVQVGIGVLRDNNPRDKPKLYPHTVMLKNKTNGTMVLSNGRPAPSDVRLCSGDASQNYGMNLDISPATHEFAGVALSGVTNPEVAKSYPDSAGRLSVQRHGIATLFALVVEKKIVEQAKYGAVVFVSGSANEQARSHIYGFEQDDHFWPYEIHVDGCGNKIYNPRTDLKIGHLVQLPPRDRNDIRVWIRPDDAQPGAAAAANPATGGGKPGGAAVEGIGANSNANKDGTALDFDIPGNSDDWTDLEEVDFPGRPVSTRTPRPQLVEQPLDEGDESLSWGNPPTPSLATKQESLQQVMAAKERASLEQMDKNTPRWAGPMTDGPATTEPAGDVAGSKRPAESDGAGPAPSKSKKASKKR